MTINNNNVQANHGLALFHSTRPNVIVMSAGPHGDIPIPLIKVTIYMSANIFYDAFIKVSISVMMQTLNYRVS